MFSLRQRRASEVEKARHETKRAGLEQVRHLHSNQGLPIEGERRRCGRLLGR